MRVWKLLLFIILIVACLLAAKAAAHFLNLEFIAVTGLMTALVGGVIFTISLLFAGTLPDYKESEKIPGEIALSIKTLFKDVKIMAAKEEGLKEHMHNKLRNLLSKIVDNFRSGRWKQSEINPIIDDLDEGIIELAGSGVQAVFIVKMRNELSAIERLSNRVETIKETSFMPAAYAIAKTVVAMVLLMMVFVRTDPFYEGLLLTGTLGFLLIGLVYLIHDIDDPFGNIDGSFANVDLELILKAEKYLQNKEKTG